MGGQKEITNLQTVRLYCLCLGAMASDALSTGAVWDALILEAVNLAVFLLAHMRKCMRWIRISGIIMILVALYMTKISGSACHGGSICWQPDWDSLSLQR